jgi:hypothetical protein
VLPHSGATGTPVRVRATNCPSDLDTGTSGGRFEAYARMARKGSATPFHLRSTDEILRARFVIPLRTPPGPAVLGVLCGNSVRDRYLRFHVLS